MIERRRLDDITFPTPAILVLILLVSVSAGVALVFAFNQLNPDHSPGILIFLSGFGAAASFIIAITTSGVGVYSLVRYLYYSKVAATLTMRADRLMYRPGDDVKVSILVDTDQSLSILSGLIRLRRVIGNGESGSSKVLSQVRLPLPQEGKHLSDGESYESSAEFSLPADALIYPNGSAGASIYWKVDAALKTNPNADAKVELVVLKAEKLTAFFNLWLPQRRPSEVQGQVAGASWLDWLEYKGYEPRLIWNDGTVDTGDHFSWALGRIRCYGGPVHNVEFRSRRRKGWRWVLNETRVHLEAGWTNRWDSGQSRLRVIGPRNKSSSHERCDDPQCHLCRWTGKDLGFGLIERLNADDSIIDLWDAPNISAGPLVPKTRDWEQNHGEVVITWRQWSTWPTFEWRSPPPESYASLDRLLGHLLGETE